MIKNCILFLWNNLWVRKDEFHRSLIMNDEAMMDMDDKEKRIYRNNLIRRRNIAHERDLKR